MLFDVQRTIFAEMVTSRRNLGSGNIFEILHTQGRIRPAKTVIGEQVYLDDSIQKDGCRTVRKKRRREHMCKRYAQMLAFSSSAISASAPRWNHRLTK